MSVSHDALLEALAGMVSGPQIKDLKETGGKVLVTLAVDVPTADKPAYADRVKQLLRDVDGVKDAFVSFAAPPGGQPQAMPTPPAPSPLEGVKHIIAVGAGKGGVGKSTVARATRWACSTRTSTDRARRS